jgi:LysR family transcriptional regulator, glycine cleavage system transcriptional activator
MVQLRRARRRLPPLHNFEAFIVAASSPSFRVAAQSLALSPAALSRRIQSLTNYLGRQAVRALCRGCPLD